MSDLQCPARIFLLRPGAADVAAVVRQLAPERLAVVHDGDDEESRDLEGLADRYRGEAVLVVGEHPYASSLVLVEVDADGRRVSPRELAGTDEVRQT